MTDQLIDRIAYNMWLSDVEADPMLHVSWEAAKTAYRRRAEVAAETMDVFA